MSPEMLMEQEFGLIADLVREYAKERPGHPAVISEGAGSTMRAGLANGSSRFRSAARRRASGRRRSRSARGASIEYATVFLGALRAGVAVAPLAPSSTPEGLVTMLADCRREDSVPRCVRRRRRWRVKGLPAGLRCVRLDGPSGTDASVTSFEAWLAPEGARPAAVRIEPDGSVQHHLFIGHDRHAEGHRPIASHALDSRAAGSDASGTTAMRSRSARRRCTRIRHW